MFVGGDVSFNGNLSVGSDVSFNKKLFVGGDTSMNGNLSVGADVSFNKKLFVRGDVSFNGNLSVGSDVSFNKKMFVGGDVSFNGNLSVGSDVSFNKKLFVGGDTSMNGNLTVGNDLSLNGNLYVVKRSVFTLDVSMLGNLDIGSGSSSFAINKDISSAFALDVSGVSKFRGNVDVSGTFTVNGAPVSAGGGGSLTGNVQVGSNSGFVSIDKPQFYSDPSLAIYYDFDVASYTSSDFYVAVGDTTNTFATSSNGTVWSGGGSAIITTQARRVTYGNGTYVAVGTGGNSIASSIDGITWTGRSTNAIGGSGYGIAYGNGIWVALGFGGGGFASCIATSTDLITWTPRSATVFTTGGNGYGAAYANGLWVAGGTLATGSNTLATSIDNGSTWTGLGSTVFDNNCRNVVYANELWVAVGGITGNTIASSTNGTTWTGGTNFVGGNTATIFSSGYSVAYGKDGTGAGLWVAVGAGTVNTIATSTNGTAWTGRGATVFATAGWDVTYTGSLWIAVGEGGNSFASSVDGTNWNGGGTTGLNTAGRGVVAAKVPGTTIANKGNGGAGLTATLQGSTTGMIDGEKKWGTASLKQNTAVSNDGMTINSTIPVSNTFSVSLWVKKSGNATIDRLFEFSNVASGTSENETIALNVNTSGKLVPIVTNGTGSAVTLSNNYIFDYNIGNNIWNNIVWILASGKSFIYINGTICQIDTVNTITNLTNRTYGYIARTNNTTGYAIENGNIDDFRYYKDKALSYAEIYQLYNNNFYTLDICGGFLANGSSVIYEPVGSVATANSGTLTLLHGDASGSSSIMFKSVNDPSDYAYIEYDENITGSTGVQYGLMTIGIENDAGSNTAQADRISLFASGGTGFVGVNTKTPLYSLDVSGQMRIYEGVGTTGNAAVGSLTLQHASNGASSIVFRSATSASDYGYIRYQDSFTTTDYSGTTESGLLTIGIENDGSTGATSDRIVLWACDNGTATATGFVGINTKNPKYTLDVNGNVNAISYNATSDYRIKKNVAPLDLTFTVDVLKPVSYVLKDDKDSKLHIGFIAHEVQKFYPFLVNGEKDGKDTQSINYNGFIGILTNEIQVLKKKVSDQEARITEQSAKALEQEARIQALEKMMLDLINK
jgi:hypothetical protein